MKNKKRIEQKYHEWMNEFSDNKGVYSTLEPRSRFTDKKSLDFVKAHGMAITEENYWAYREALNSLRRYNLPSFAESITYKNSKYAHLHFLHISEDKPGSMVAFTESPEKGREDKRTKMKIGKYLNRYFSDVLNPDDIRRHANDQEREYGDKSLNFQDMDSIENILKIYREGPASCMSKPSSHYSADGHHPLEAYVGSGLKIAYLTRGDRITARVIVNPDNNKFVPKIYGDDELKYKLIDAGWEASMDALKGVRLQLIYLGDECYVCPYLDGNYTYVDIYSDHMRIVYSGEYDTNKENVHSNGYVGGLNAFCECCELDVEETTFVEYDNIHVCDLCLEAYYRYAYNTNGYQILINEEDTVYCESDQEYYHKDCIEDDIVNVGGDYYRKDDEDIVETHNDEWEFRAYCVEIDGEWVPKDECVEIDGEWYRKDDDDVVTLANGEYALEDDCVEIDGKWYLDAEEAA